MSLSSWTQVWCRYYKKKLVKEHAIWLIYTIIKANARVWWVSSYEVRQFQNLNIIDDIFNDASSGGAHKTGLNIKKIFMSFSVRVGAFW